jgi:hypothetical protein
MNTDLEQGNGVGHKDAQDSQDFSKHERMCAWRTAWHAIPAQQIFFFPAAFSFCAYCG